MNKFKQKQRGFLLIEQLIALSLFGVSLLLIMGFYRILAALEKQLAIPDAIEWHLCVTQLDSQLSGYEIDQEWRNQYTFTDYTQLKRPTSELKTRLKGAEKPAAFWISKNKGFQALLLEQQQLQLTKTTRGIHLQATLKNGRKEALTVVPSVREIVIEKQIRQEVEEEKKRETLAVEKEEE